jgi:hypothetical protein
LVTSWSIGVGVTPAASRFALACRSSSRPPSILKATWWSPAADFHHREVVVIAKGEERHLHAVLIKASADGQPEQAVVKLFGARTVRHPEHYVTQGLDLHRLRPP